MRILLATNASYIPTRGGATRANRAWLERLASHGHSCQVITSAASIATEFKRQQLQNEVSAEGILEDIASTTAGDSVFWNGVEVCHAPQQAGIVSQMEQAVRSYSPDWILISSEDFGQARLRIAQRLAPGKIVYLAHTPQFLPFGSESLNSNAIGARAIADAAGVVVIGEYMRKYCQDFLQKEVLVAHPPIYGIGPFANYGASNKGFITMINPCGVKGLSIFLAIAARFPGLQFAVLPGWGTTPGDIENISRAGIRILPPCRNIDDVLSKTRVLLVPSLWSEGFGLIVVEAMLRGIPVVTSNLGGLPEAKMNTAHILTVIPIDKYLPIRDEHLMPIPEIPQQSIDPWVSILGELTDSDTLYGIASRDARSAALRFVESVDFDRLESALSTRLCSKAT